MNPWGEAMQARTRRFEIDVINLVRSLRCGPEIDTIKRQLVDAASSTADNYRSACRSRSHAEFTARIGMVLDEADESEHWLSVLYDAGLSHTAETARLRGEAAELRSIFARSTLTANENEKRRRGRRL